MKIFIIFNGFTYTVSSILALDKSRIAHAVVATVCIYTSSIGANTFLLTLVSVLACIRLGIPCLSLGALAGERTRRVHALSTLAETWYCFALVDIWRFFWHEPRSKMETRKRVVRVVVEELDGPIPSVSTIITHQRTGLGWSSSAPTRSPTWRGTFRRGGPNPCPRWRSTTASCKPHLEDSPSTVHFSLSCSTDQSCGNSR